MKQTPGKIYLSDQRGIFETTQYCRFCTFNFEEFYQEHKVPYGNLYTFNEEILAGGHRITSKVDVSSYVLILPVTGKLHLMCEAGKVTAVDVGELLIQTVPVDHA